MTSPAHTDERRERLLDALEMILKTESEPAMRRCARQRYLDLTTPVDERQAA